MAYAQTTTVAFEKSISEIITLLKRADAARIMQDDHDLWFSIAFQVGDRLIRFKLPLPLINEMPQYDGRRMALSDKQRLGKLDQAKRQRGRALLLVIKAKLESVESGIETLEQAFLAHVVMSNGETVYDRISSGIAIEYQEGRPTTVAGLLGGPA